MGMHECRAWIWQKYEASHSWDEIKHLCVDDFEFEDEFERLKLDDVIPEEMTVEDWHLLVDQERKENIIIKRYGLDNGVPTDKIFTLKGPGSSWERYDLYQRGLGPDGIVKISGPSMDVLFDNCNWLVEHLRSSTEQGKPNKGLVMGSVQSGKTANMIGLATMAADRGYNFVIVLSGTIDNLRVQTRDRFADDLEKCNSEGVVWHMLDYSSTENCMEDLFLKERIFADDLKLTDAWEENAPRHQARYVTVCLKQAKRLERLIKWLYSCPEQAKKLRLLIIDDEADQASVNTKPIHDDETEEDVAERTIINNLIVNLVHGKKHDGSAPDAPFRSVNYLSFTATPYANVLNEEKGLYPSDFIYSLPEAKGYFGAKAIFGSYSDENYPGMNVVRTISGNELLHIKGINSGDKQDLPTQFQLSIGWFLCSAAILRTRFDRQCGPKYKKPISMLIHTTARNTDHFYEYKVLRNWLSDRSSVLGICRMAYETEKGKFLKKDLAYAYPDYEFLDDVLEDFPCFEDIQDEISVLIQNIANIQLTDKETVFSDDQLYICVDNCKANKNAEEGTTLRLKYPTKEQLATMSKAPVFIVIGGNTLSRGLTIEGLSCTYFSRDCKQADTLMQMARWFGYRKGYELLQRIWLSESAQKRFRVLQRIDEQLKAEIADFVDKGLKPKDFGPRVSVTGEARFNVTAKNKMQSASGCDYHYPGYTSETTEFSDNTIVLQGNINLTETFLKKLGNPRKSVSDKDIVWENISFDLIKSSFLDQFEHAEEVETESQKSFYRWMSDMNAAGKYLRWNVAAAGGAKTGKPWKIGALSVTKIRRTRISNFSNIDIGSLRSGADALCDATDPNAIPTTRAQKKNYNAARCDFGLEDIPLLLLYRIDNESAPTEKEKGTRSALGTKVDVIGYAIIVPGEKVSSNYASALAIAMN